jgi:dTDP-4-amino-4,6-dideoxygalactose transaminase
MAGAMKYKEFETKFARYVDSKYAVSCNNGTSALHLALLAVGITKGDEVIVPDFTMAACGFAVSYTGARPKFVDCDDTLNIDVSLIEKAITKRTKAIMAVHIYGRLCNMKEILRIARKYKLKVIEDASEAHGAVFNSKADITCYSLFKNKIIHAEEGGVCTTNNKKYAKKIEYLKNMAFGKKHNYFHTDIGYNYRMPESQAVLAIKSLLNVGKELKRRRNFESKLNRIINNKLPKRDVVWVYDYIGKPIKGYETRPFFKPLSSFPMYGGECTSPKALHYSKIGNIIKI